MTTTSRLTDWPRRLSDYIQMRRRTPFAWGVNDCCTFAMGAVGAVRGAEPLPELRSHRSAFAATRVLVRHGCRTTIDMMMLALGEPLPSPRLAGRGDVVAIDVTRQPIIGVCLGTSCAFAAETGLIFVPRGAVEIAWRV